VEIFLAALGPVLGLLGTVFGVWLGHRQWKQEAARTDAASFQEHLREAYFKLWDVVEEAHLKMRGALDGLTPEVFSGFLADVNNFMIRHGLYIEREDRTLVLEYLFWTNEYLRILSQSPRGRALLEVSLAVVTDAEGRQLSSNVALLSEVQDRAQDLRNRLRSRIRDVVGAPPSDAWDIDKQTSEDLLTKLTELVDIVERRQTREDRPPNLILRPEGHSTGLAEGWESLEWGPTSQLSP